MMQKSPASLKDSPVTTITNLLNQKIKDSVIPHCLEHPGCTVELVPGQTTNHSNNLQVMVTPFVWRVKLAGGDLTTPSKLEIAQSTVELERIVRMSSTTSKISKIRGYRWKSDDGKKWFYRFEVPGLTKLAVQLQANGEEVVISGELSALENQSQAVAIPGGSIPTGLLPGRHEIAFAIPRFYDPSTLVRVPELEEPGILVLVVYHNEKKNLLGAEE